MTRTEDTETPNQREEDSSEESRLETSPNLQVPLIQSPGDIASVTSMFERRYLDRAPGLFGNDNGNIEFHIHAFVQPLQPENN
jgi:hypothetical protein